MNNGSFICPGTPDEHVETAKFLTLDGIMAKYSIKAEDLRTMSKGLYGMKFRDILFHFPDGVRRDIAMNLMATSR